MTHFGTRSVDAYLHRDRFELYDVIEDPDEVVKAAKALDLAKLAALVMVGKTLEEIEKHIAAKTELGNDLVRRIERLRRHGRRRLRRCRPPRRQGRRDGGVGRVRAGERRRHPPADRRRPRRRRWQPPPSRSSSTRAS